MSISTIRDWAGKNWQTIALYGGLFLFLGILLVVRLDSLLPGYSQAAVTAYESGVSVHQILQQPLNAPLSVVAYGISQLHSSHSLLLMRLVTAGLGLITLMLFCGLVRYWHGERTAVFATLLLGTSSWFLQTSRSGTAMVLTFGLFALIACGVWLRKTRNPLSVLLGMLLAGGLVYVPGMIWLIGLGIVWQWRTLDKIFKKRLGVVTLGACLFVAILAPLAWSIYQHPAIAKELLNLPAQGWPTPAAVVRDLLAVPLHIFVKGNDEAITLVRQLPMLDFFASSMFLLGGYLYLRHIGLHRSRLLLVMFIAGAGMIALGGSANLSLFIPFLYLVAAAGIDYLLAQWFRTFPRNPIAQGVGMFAVGAVVTLACAYHLRTYFVAFPQSTSTQAVYTHQEPQ